VAFLSRLLEAGVDVRFADLPQIGGATGRFLLQQMVAVAELEAAMISARTKAALAACAPHNLKVLNRFAKALLTTAPRPEDPCLKFDYAQYKYFAPA
jgi:Resolvase, N terminal domain